MFRMPNYFRFSSVNKQINDKERIAAAMENSSLREIVESCIKERDDWVQIYRRETN